MELSRRDAIAALAAGGAVAGGGALTWEQLRASEREGGGTDSASDGDGGGAGDGGGEAPTPEEVETLVAVAETLYPSAVSGVDEFVETYVVGRIRGRESYAAGVREALATLDDYAEDWYGDRAAALDSEERDRLLREIGLETADPDPDGYAPARLRYYLVNELLYALYASPTGGELVGIENPQGHPGGIDSYRRGPEA